MEIKFRAYHKEYKKIYLLDGISNTHYGVDNNWHTKEQFEEEQLKELHIKKDLKDDGHK